MMSIQFALADKDLPKPREIASLIERIVLAEEYGEDNCGGDAGEVIRPLLRAYWVLVSIADKNVAEVQGQELTDLWRSEFCKAYKALAQVEPHADDGWPQEFMFEAVWPRWLVIRLAQMDAAGTLAMRKAFQQMAAERQATQGA